MRSQSRRKDKEWFMGHYFWDDLYTNWGWFLWVAVIVFVIFNVGNWGYTYNAHRKYEDFSRKGFTNILDERYARGELEREDYMRLKSEITDDFKSHPMKEA
jgi:putative membrane protein